jgi:hypothetical protein
MAFSGKHHESLFRGQWFSFLVCLFGCCPSYILHKGHVVVVGDRNTLKPTFTAGQHKLFRIGPPFFVSNVIVAGPVTITRCVDL